MTHPINYFKGVDCLLKLEELLICCLASSTAVFSLKLFTHSHVASLYTEASLLLMMDSMTAA
jgi:hypothetical protein